MESFSFQRVASNWPPLWFDYDIFPIDSRGPHSLAAGITGEIVDHLRSNAWLLAVCSPGKGL